MLPFGVGVKPDTPWIEGVIRHEQSGLLVAPDLGVVYGVAGRPVGVVCADGYVRLGGRRRGYLYAHRVIYEATWGPIPSGLEIDHVNGDKADNRACNLEAVTRAENVQRAVAMGLAPVGESRSDAKLTEADVLAIRSTVGKVTVRDWARRLGVDPATVRGARDGMTWKHVRMRGRAKPVVSEGGAELSRQSTGDAATRSNAGKKRARPRRGSQEVAK